MNIRRLVILLASIHAIIGNVQFRNPAAERNDFRSEKGYWCSSDGDLVPGNKLRTPQKVFWVEKGPFEIEFNYQRDRNNQNYTMKIWVVRWDQDLKNKTAILPPIVSRGFPRRVNADTYSGVYATDKLGILKLPSSNKNMRLNITLDRSHVCRPESFRCNLIIEQNRTGNFPPGTSWKTCSRVLVFSKANNVRLTITMKNPTPVFVNSVKVQLFANYKDDGFTAETVEQISPKEGEEFKATSDGTYSLVVDIMDQVGFNSDTVAETIRDTYEERTSVDIVSVGYTMPNNSGTKLSGMGIVAGIVFIFFSSLL